MWVYRAVRALVVDRAMGRVGVGVVVSIGTRRKSVERRGDAKKIWC